MGQGSREDLRPSFSRGNSEHCGEYVDIGEDNPNEADKAYYRNKTNCSHDYKVIIGAGELEQLGDITKELVDYFGPTESDRECSCCIQGS